MNKFLLKVRFWVQTFTIRSLCMLLCVHQALAMGRYNCHRQLRLWSLRVLHFNKMYAKTTKFYRQNKTNELNTYTGKFNTEVTILFRVYTQRTSLINFHFSV